MIIGHKKNIALLHSLAKEGGLFHALLLTGPEGVGKGHTAKEFAKWLQNPAHEDFAKFAARAACSCSSCASAGKGAHPDIHCFSGAMDVASAREIVHLSALSPYLGPYSIFIIEEADKLSSESANTLLKSIEEPVSRTLFLMTASSLNAVLPTITSRSVLLRFGMVSAKEAEALLSVPGATPQGAVVPQAKQGKDFENFARIFKGRPGFIHRFFNDEDFKNDYLKAERFSARFLKGGVAERLAVAEELYALKPEEFAKTMSLWAAIYEYQGNYQNAGVLLDIAKNSRLSVQSSLALTYAALHDSFLNV